MDVIWHWPTPIELVAAGNVALILAALMVVFGRMYARAVKAEAAAAAAIIATALVTESTRAADLVAARLQAVAEVEAARLLATARLVEDTRATGIHPAPTEEKDHLHYDARYLG